MILALTYKSGEMVKKILIEVKERYKTAVVLSTHYSEKHMDKTIDTKLIFVDEHGKIKTV